jgi:hypothetical protein
LSFEGKRKATGCAECDRLRDARYSVPCTGWFESGGALHNHAREQGRRQNVVYAQAQKSAPDPLALTAEELYVAAQMGIGLEAMREQKRKDKIEELTGRIDALEFINNWNRRYADLLDDDGDGQANDGCAAAGGGTCRKGSAIEIFGKGSSSANNNNIHHNLAVDNKTFSELGKIQPGEGRPTVTHTPLTLCAARCQRRCAATLAGVRLERASRGSPASLREGQQTW